MCILRNIKTKGSVWEDRRDYIRWANIVSAHRRSLTKIKPTLLSWNILGIGKLYVRQQMSLLRKPTGIRTAIKVVEKFVSVMDLSTNVSINCCWHVLTGLTLCLQSIMKSIPIKSLLTLFRDSLQISH